MLKPGKKDRTLQLFSIFFIISCLPVLSGCVTGQVMLDRAVVINATDGIISEVKVRHEPTGKIGAASMILPQTSFDLGFPKQPMRGKEAIVTWRDHQGLQRRTVLSLPNGYTTEKGRTMSLVYTIRPSGEVTVELVE